MILYIMKCFLIGHKQITVFDLFNQARPSEVGRGRGADLIFGKILAEIETDPVPFNNAIAF